MKCDNPNCGKPLKPGDTVYWVPTLVCGCCSTDCLARYILNIKKGTLEQYYAAGGVDNENGGRNI